MFILPTIRINGAQYRGKMATAEVLRAICAGFVEGNMPQACSKVGWGGGLRVGGGVVGGVEAEGGFPALALLEGAGGWPQGPRHAAGLRGGAGSAGWCAWGAGAADLLRAWAWPARPCNEFSDST